MSEATQNDTAETMEWYRLNSAFPPFDPDGMCLKICRSARNIASRYPSAFSAMVNTPKKYRIYKVSELRRGHALYFDDPNDSNPFGHIVTMIGRVPNADMDSLHDILVRTNAIIKNKIVIVRGDYFNPHWSDPFKFGASYLNGEPFYDMQPKPKPKPKLKKRASIRDSLNSIIDGIPEMREAIQANKGNKRAHDALQRDLKKMIETRDSLREILASKKGK